MIVGKQRVPLRKNECILVFPNVEHAYEGDRKANCGLMQLEFSVRRNGKSVGADHLSGPGCGYLKPARSELPKSIIDNIYHYRQIHAGYADELLKYEFLQLFALFAGQYAANEAPAADSEALSPMRKLEQAMLEHYTESVNLEKLAETYGISSRAIRKHFENHYGVSPVQYLTGLRVKRACELLHETDESITEIALSCGFGSSQYFSRVFRTYTDMMPRQYRKTWKNTNTENTEETDDEQT